MRPAAGGLVFTLAGCSFLALWSGRSEIGFQNIRLRHKKGFFFSL